MLKNLNDYNAGNSAGSIAGIGKSIADRMEKTTDAVGDSLQQIYDALKDPKNTDNYVRLVKMLKTQQVSTLSISQDYSELYTQLAITSEPSEKVLSELAKMHVTLIQTNKILLAGKDAAQGTCNQQNTGAGNCRGK